MSMVEYCGAPYEHPAHMWKHGVDEVYRCSGVDTEQDDIDAYTRIDDELEAQGYFDA